MFSSIMNTLYNELWYKLMKYDELKRKRSLASKGSKLLMAPTSARKMARRLLLAAVLAILVHALVCPTAAALPDRRYFSTTRVVQSVSDPFIRGAAEVTRDELWMFTISFSN